MFYKTLYLLENETNVNCVSLDFYVTVERHLAYFMFRNIRMQGNCGFFDKNSMMNR